MNAAAGMGRRLAGGTEHVYVQKRQNGTVVEFEWDNRKAAVNLMKHGVAFELARSVWDDPLHIVLPDRTEGGEQRWHAIGLVGPVIMLVVVHSHPDPEHEDRIRIIGACKATPHERRRYEEDL